MSGKIKWEKRSKRILIMSVILAVAVLTTCYALLATLGKDWEGCTVTACAVTAVTLIALFFTVIYLQLRFIYKTHEEKRVASGINEALASLIYDLSREIRTPLNDVAGMAKIALANIDDKDQVKTCLHNIADACTKMTSIVVELPEKVSGEHSSPELLPQANDAPVDFDLTGKKLIIAEDNEISREIARTLLTEAGFEVVCADNGQTCVDNLLASKPHTYDAILMDLRMPVMDGIEATRVIRSLKRGYNSIPIIAMTADAFDGDVRRCLDSGMNAHVSKPMDVDTVKTVLAKILSDKQ